MADNPEMQSEVTTSAEMPASAFCASLRSKKFFLLDVIPNEASQYLDGSNHCWCRETQQAVGPDGGMAQPEHCVLGRACYSSAFDA